MPIRLHYPPGVGGVWEQSLGPRYREGVWRLQMGSIGAGGRLAARDVDVYVYVDVDVDVDVG